MANTNPYENIDINEVKKIAEEIAKTPPEGWSRSSGQSPLKKQLQLIVKLLEGIRNETVKQQTEQIKILQKMMSHQMKTNTTNRVSKK